MPRLSDYDYVLPEDRIAQTPLADRTASRLLHLDRRTGKVGHGSFGDVPELLRPGDLLVLNDTRVTAIRLFGKKETGGEVEALLLSEETPGSFVALMRPGRRLKQQARIVFEGGLRARVCDELSEGRKLIQFDELDGLGDRLAKVGRVPLPPYIHAELSDPERYQTVLARRGGSAAAPTAGLHFSKELLEAIAARGVQTATVTLDVGIDTFRPVQTEDLSEHRMHGERCEVGPETAAKVRECEGRVIAVGTTAVRTLETFAAGHRVLETGSRVSSLFIQPGYEFQIVDGMFTNFHLPRTTMLIMISALCVREWVMAAYGEALANGYRFLSFGDSMLIL